MRFLQGVGRFIKQNKIKAIHFEFNEMKIEDKISIKDYWVLLDNYHLYRLLPGGKLIEKSYYKPVPCEVGAFQDIVATQQV